jgi:GTP:adenosylcobinamide-phosphate guanylyltransferase
MQVPEGYNSRAMVQIGSKTMLQWVVDALKSSQTVGRLVAVGNVAAEGLDQTLEPSTGFFENMMIGLEACDPNEPVLILSSDIPLITGEAIDDFVNRAVETGGEMCYPVITKESCMAKYPQMKRTFFKTKDGTFTGGNMLLMSPAFLRANESRIAGAYAARKQPLKLAAMVGFGVLIRAAIAQFVCPAILPVPMLERAVGKMLGGKVVAIPTDYPEIGEDVDKPSDLDAVRKLLLPLRNADCGMRNGGKGSGDR